MSDTAQSIDADGHCVGYTALHWDDVSSPFPGKQPTPTPAGRSHAQNRVGPLVSSTLYC